MIENKLEAVQQQLGITVPGEYRELMIARADELRNIGCFEGQFSQLFLETEIVIRDNLLERAEDSGTAYAFPEWWKTFFLIGTNGAGDYYTLRLDGVAGVWMIGSDCGDEPTLIADSFAGFVDELVANHKAEQLQKDEITNKRLVYQAEISAHCDAAALAGKSTETTKWFDCSNGSPMFRMLDRLPHKVSARKLRLYGIACCRLIPSLNEDEHCVAGIACAERMTLGEASEVEIVEMRTRMRARLEELEKRCVSSEAVLCKQTQAVQNLFQEDDHYLKDGPIYPNDPQLSEVYNSVSYALYSEPYGSDVELDLLREVLGNPFLPVLFDQAWRSSRVVELAEQIYESQNFTPMSMLAEALVEAGCNDARIITHCQRSTGHVRGCWVLDLILEKEPEPGATAFSWDFQCKHPKIDPTALKERLKAFGTAGQFDRSDDKALFDFADWLEMQGDADWAEYIRVRCALDVKPPGDDYFDLLERLHECSAGMQSKIVEFENIYFSGYRFAEDNWWEEDTEDFERGLPALVHAVIPGKDAGPPQQLMQRIEALVENTPVRGVDFEKYYAPDMAEILNSRGGSQLRYLKFENRNEGAATTSPVLHALAKAAATANLERLSIQNGITSDGDALALAAAPLNQLRRLDMKYGGIACSPGAAEKLMTTPWFNQLRQLSCRVGEECATVAVDHLSRMPQLHSLALDRLPERAIQAFADADEFVALRRLHLNRADLTGTAGKAFCTTRTPQLIDLWLEDCEAGTEDVRAIIESPWFGNLRAVSFAGPRFDEVSLGLLAQSLCAPKLRVLRLMCGDDNCLGSFTSLGKSALAGDSFASLTTLQIKDPFAKGARRDTAKFLRQLVTPNLRHLSLENCHFDDDCAAAISENPSFASLTRLVLKQGYSKVPLLSSSAFETMIRSANLKNMVQIEINDFPLSNAVESLADSCVLPKLKQGTIWGSRAEQTSRDLMKNNRPNVYIGS